MNKAILYVAPQKAAIQEIPHFTCGDGEAVVHTKFSALSRGTERLVFHGRVPESEFERMRAPFQEGAFPFPVKYGYAAVGVVTEGPPDLVGERVFCLYPHQNIFLAPVSALTRVPQDVPSPRAALAANMETALNAVWDAGLGPGDRIAIVGAGVLGGLLAGLCGAIPGAEVCLVDVNPARRALADHMKVSFIDPNVAGSALFETEADVVFHTSATESGLVTALGLAGVEAAVVELSWYGDNPPRIPLGEAFHSRRLRLVSSQVGRIGEASDRRRTRWDYRRRLSKALELLADPRYEALITEEVAFDDLPRELPRLLADPSPDAGAPGLATIVRHPDA